MSQTLRAIADLKAAIHDLEGFPCDRQRLIFRGRECDSESSLSSLGIVQGSIMHLVLRYET